MLAYSLRESFDRENPWVRRLTGFGGSRGGRRQRAGIASFLVVAALLAVAWTLALAFGHRQFSSALVTVSYTLAVFLALAAPASGAAARAALDSDPCLRESLASPVTDRQYVAALHGRVLMVAFVGLAAYGVSAAAIAVALSLGEPSAVFDPPPYVLHLFFRYVGFAQVPTFDATSLLLVLAAVLATALSYAAGAYLHATLLAAVCSLAPNSRSRGGILTVALVVALPLLLFLRLGLPAMLLFESPSAERLLVLIATVECTFAALRLWLARIVWRRMERTALSETRQWLFDRK